MPGSGNEDDKTKLNETVVNSAETVDSRRYHKVRSLGAGGMGEVFLAEDSALHRYVAIKTVRADLCRDEALRRRIKRECELHAKVGPHTHIVTLFDRLEQDDGQISLVMEFVDGDTLEELLKNLEAGGEIMPVRQALEIAMQTLDGLSRIHTHGVIHRDIKPSNIILGIEEDGAFCAKLMDFGIARHADESEQPTKLTALDSGGPGTPLYMSPEQIDPKTFGELSPATDVYAMGVMLYQMIEGEPPFHGNLTTIFNGHLTQEPPEIPLPSGVGGIVGDLIHRALAKKPADRFASGREFRDAIAACLDNVEAGVHALHGGATVCPPGSLPGEQSTVPAGATVRTPWQAPQPESGDPGRTVVADASSSAPSCSTVLAGATTGGVQPRRSSLPLWAVVMGVLLLIAAVGAGAVAFKALKGDKKDGNETAQIESTPTPAPTPTPTATPSATPPPSVTLTPALAQLTPTPTPMTATPVTPAPAPMTAAPAASETPETTGSAVEALKAAIAQHPPQPQPTAAPQTTPKPGPKPTPRLTPTPKAPDNLAVASKQAAKSRREQFLNTPAKGRVHERNDFYIEAEHAMNKARDAEDAGDYRTAREYYDSAEIKYKKAIADIKKTGFQIK